MKHAATGFALTIDRVNRVIGRATAWLTIAMVVIYCIVVAMRYVFDAGSIALQESVTYLHAMVFMLSASWALQDDAHVRVDIFYSRWGPARKAAVDLGGSLLLLLPVAIYLFAVSWDYVAESWARQETSAESGGLPFVYLLKTLLLVMAAQLSLQAIAQATKALNRLLEAKGQR